MVLANFLRIEKGRGSKKDDQLDVIIYIYIYISTIEGGRKIQMKKIL